MSGSSQEIIISDDYVESATAVLMKYAEVYQNTVNQMIRIFETDVKSAFPSGKTAEALQSFKESIDSLKKIGELGNSAGKAVSTFLSDIDEIDDVIY